MAEIWGAVAGGVGALAGGLLGSKGAKDAARAEAKAAEAAAAEQRRQFDLMREDTAPYRAIGQQALGALGGIYGYKPSTAGAVGPSGGNALAPSNGVIGNVVGQVTGSSPKFNPIDPMTGLPRGGNALGVGGEGATAAGPPMPAGPDYSNFFASPDYQFRRDQGIQGIERTASARGLTGSGNALAALADYNSNLAAGEFGNYFNRQAQLAGIGQGAVNTSTAAGANAAGNIGNALIGAGSARASGIADSANAWGNALGTIGGIAYDRWGRKKTGGT